MNYQRDPRWIYRPLGFSTSTIGAYGCTVSVIGNILGKTPVEVNEALKKVNGFANGNLVIWDKISEAFPGTKVKRVNGYNNDEVKANVPNVICEVSGAAIGGTGKHWIQYIGNQKCNDPWTGKTRPTSDFGTPSGYAIIIPPTPSMTDAQKVAKITEIVYSNDNSDTKINRIKDVIK